MKEMNMVDLIEATERLEAVAEALENAAAGLADERVALASETRMTLAAEAQMALAGEAQEHVGRIVATVETAREGELERKLAAAEARIVELMAGAAVQVVASQAGRKTLPAGMVSMLAKQGVVLDMGAAGTSLEASALDGALVSLSIEQRIAVKAELRRAGLLG